MKPALIVRIAATISGSELLIENNTPESNGAAADPNACTDWLIPNISPWADLSAELEIIVCKFGPINPFEIATRGKIKYRIVLSLGIVKA